jgi:hypothetical protein
MQVRDLIRALGGPVSVGARLGVTSQAVSNAVRRQRLPAEWHFPLWQMALDAGVDWTPPGAEGLRDRLRSTSAPEAA